MVLNGQKKLLDIKDVKCLIAPPRMNGLRIADLWEDVKDVPEVNVYFPVLRGRTPSKNYFFAVGSAWSNR